MQVVLVAQGRARRMPDEVHRLALHRAEENLARIEASTQFPAPCDVVQAKQGADLVLWDDKTSKRCGCGDCLGAPASDQRGAA